MAYEETLKMISLLANGDQSGNQYLFMKFTASGIEVCDTAGEDAIGVLQDKPTAGKVGAIAYSGVSKVIVGTGGITAGAGVQTNASGEAIAASTGDYKLGVALQTGAAGAIVPVLLFGAGQNN
jgi:hypothetical protein